MDDDLWWLWCGDECAGKFVGPHLTPEAAEADRVRSGCEHDHMVFRMSLRQMAAKLPKEVRWWAMGIFDPRRTPARVLISQPLYPLESAQAWFDMAAALVMLKKEASWTI